MVDERQIKNGSPVIAAESALLQSETQGAQSRAEVEISLIRLYKALGGGWQGVDARPIAVGQQPLAQADRP